MKCEDIHEWFGIYWDLPEDDPNKQAVDAHIRECSACAEEFEMWTESTDLIRSAAEHEVHEAPGRSVSSQVMQRIYQEESWRMPVGDRLYKFSYKLRRNLTAAIGLSIALFMFAFLFSLTGTPGSETALEQQSSVFGRLGDPVVLASGQPDTDSLDVHSMPTAVASLQGFNKPFTYHAGPIHTVRDYVMFLSLVGLTCTLLIMNWFTRTRH